MISFEKTLITILKFDCDGSELLNLTDKRQPRLNLAKVRLQFVQ